MQFCLDSIHQLIGMSLQGLFLGFYDWLKRVVCISFYLHQGAITCLQFTHKFLFACVLLVVVVDNVIKNKIKTLPMLCVSNIVPLALTVSMAGTYVIQKVRADARKLCCRSE